MLMSIIKDRMFTLYKRAIPEKKVKSRKISPQIKKRQFRRMPVLAFLCTDLSV